MRWAYEVEGQARLRRGRWIWLEGKEPRVVSRMRGIDPGLLADAVSGHSDGMLRVAGLVGRNSWRLDGALPQRFPR